MLIEKIALYTTGSKCIKCNNTNLYRLKNNKVKCLKCKSRYGLKKLSKELWCLYFFSLEMTANKTSKELNINYNTVLSKYKYFREKIVQYQWNTFQLLKIENDGDDSYFVGYFKYLKCSSKSNEIEVLGLLERKKQIFITMFEKLKASDYPIIIKTTKTGIIRSSNTYPLTGYLLSKFFYKDFTINHILEFADRVKYLNRFERFWSYTKKQLLKYRGISKSNLYLYLKEIEFRYNNRNSNIFNLLNKIIFNYNLN